MMRLARGTTGPDEFGWLELEGNPTDLKEGDEVLDQQYAVLRIAPAKHEQKPATQLTLVESGAYQFEVPRGGIPEEEGRIVLLNNTSLKFRRLTGEMDWGEEPEMFMNLEQCVHDEHDAYTQEWRGMTKDLPPGALVGINLEGDDAIKLSCKIVDSTYGTGAVVFTDGVVYQSHPNYEWYAWLKP